MKRLRTLLFAWLLTAAAGCVSMPHPPLEHARTPVQRMRWATRDRLETVAESDFVTCIITPIGVVGNLAKGSWNGGSWNDSMRLNAR